MATIEYTQGMLAALSPDLKSTLDTVLRRFKHGKRGWGNDGVHKVSASDTWRLYAEAVKTYPRPVHYKDMHWHIVDMTCGIRRGDDYLVLIREVEPEVFVKTFLGDDAKDPFWSTWPKSTEQWFWDEELLICYQMVAVAPEYLEDTDDVFFKFWLDTIEEQPCIDENHADNAVRKLARTYTYYKRKEQTAKEYPLGGEFIVCGRCYKRACCCDSGKTRDLSYEINVHAMSVEISKGFRTLDLTMDEVQELASFFASAKTKLKEAKVAELTAQAESLAKAIEEAKSL